MAHRYRHWTILQTQQASSLKAAKHAKDQGFECYRPLYRTSPVRGVRHVKQLFERYLFVQVDLRRRWQVLHSTRGVSRLFLTAGVPHEIDGRHIEWIQSREIDSGYFVLPSEEAPRFIVGDKVRGAGGLFADNIGIYQGLGKNAQATRRVLFSILGQSVEFEIKARDLVAA